MRWMVKMGNFDEGTSEETGEGDRAVVLGRGWLDPGEKMVKGAISAALVRRACQVKEKRMLRWAS